MSACTITFPLLSLTFSDGTITVPFHIAAVQTGAVVDESPALLENYEPVGVASTVHARPSRRKRRRSMRMAK